MKERIFASTRNKSKQNFASLGEKKRILSSMEKKGFFHQNRRSHNILELDIETHNPLIDYQKNVDP
jgi:hypothetical protein